MESDKNDDAMSQTVAGAVFQAEMEDLDSMELVDRKIIAATLLGVDITEVYSPEQMAKVAQRYGLAAGSSMNLTTGFDFTKEADRQLAWKRIRQEARLYSLDHPRVRISA